MTFSLRGCKWVRTTTRRPCPVCAGTSWCSTTTIHGEAIVKCMRRGDTSQSPGLSPVPPPAGTRRTDRNGVEYFLWRSGTGSLPEVDPAAVAKQEKEDRENAELGKEIARNIWKYARPVAAGGPVMKYFAGRGLAIPSCPRAIRYTPRCIDENKKGRENFQIKGTPVYVAPAMISAVVNESGGLDGVHRTFITEDGRKRDEKEFGPAKKSRGGTKGRAIRLSEKYASGVLVLAEGIETAMACMMAARVAAWSTISAQGLAALRLPTGVVGTPDSPGPVRTIVIAADRDRSKAGEKFAEHACSCFRRDFPHLTVRVALPGPEHAPKLFENGTPIAKGVDWLDVFNAEGPDAVCDGLALPRPTRPTTPASPTPPISSVPVDPVPHSAAPQPPDDSGGGSGTSGGGGVSGEGGDGDGGPLGIDGVPLEMLGSLAWKNDEGRWVISPSSVDRARVYLLSECYRPGDSVWRLLRWAGVWFKWAGWRWVRLDDDQLRHELACWLRTFRSVRKGGRGGAEFIVDPEPEDLDKVAKFLAGECYVAANEVPVFVPPMIENGQPKWGRAVKTWEVGKASGVREGVNAKDLVPFRQGCLDLAALREGVVRVVPHCPDLFTTSARPYAIDLDVLQAVLGRDSLTWRPEDFETACPLWGRFLGDITDGDDGPTRADRLAVLQEMLGDAVTLDRSIEKIMMLVGPGRSGKTLVEHVITALAGEDNVAATSFESLVGNFGLAPLVGRPVTIMGDAHLTDMQTGSRALTPLKTISGNGAIQVRDLYTKAIPRVILGTRFWIIMNDEPDKIRDNSGVIVDRLVIFAFTRTFLGRENPKLKQKIPGEASGIAAWALCGHVRTWGKATPTIESTGKGKAMQAELRRIASPMLDFCEQCLDLGSDEQGPYVGTIAELYGAYIQWCKAEGKEPVGQNVFVMRLTSVASRAGVNIERTQPGASVDPSRRRCLRGVRLRPGREDLASTMGVS